MYSDGLTISQIVGALVSCIQVVPESVERQKFMGATTNIFVPFADIATPTALLIWFEVHVVPELVDKNTAAFWKPDTLRTVAAKVLPSADEAHAPQNTLVFGSPCHS